MPLIQSLSYGSASRNEFRALTRWLSVDLNEEKKKKNQTCLIKWEHSHVSPQIRTDSMQSYLACSWIEQLAFRYNTVINKIV